jgi:inhibitor of cysteine peptidase
MLGDELVLRLQERPTTGYRWAVDSIDPEVLRMAGSSFRPSSSGVGAGGERFLTFVAAATGSTVLQLKLWRAWEGEGSVQRRIALDVTVRR